MRIAVFIKRTTYHDGYGGLETQNRALCEGLVHRGHDVSVFSPQWDLKYETKYDNGVKYHFIPCVYRLLRFGKNNWFYKSREVFEKYHTETPFDLVLSQSSAGVAVGLKKRVFGVPFVSVAHGSIIGEIQTQIRSSQTIRDYVRILKNLPFVLVNFFGRQRKFIHASDKIIAVSSAVKDALVEETFASEDKITVINNGIDPAPFKEVSAAERISGPASLENSPSILYIGQITKSKGLDVLYKLSAESEFSKIRFDVIGGGDYFSELEDKVRVSADKSKNFILHGKKPYKEVLSFLKSAGNSVFVFPTMRSEGFPMVLVESLFAGIPVVAYDVGGVSDAVIDQETGFLVPSGDYGQLKEKVLLLLQEPLLRKELSQKSRLYAHKNLSLDAMISTYEEIFKEVKK